MTDPVHSGRTPGFTLLQRLGIVTDDSQLSEQLRLEFTRALGPSFGAFLFGGTVAASLSFAIALMANSSLALFFSVVALIGFGFVVSACHAARSPLTVAQLRRVEQRYCLGSILTSLAMGCIILAVILAGAPFIMQTLLVMVGLAALGIGSGSGPGRPQVALAQAVGLGVPMAVATLIAWPVPWNIASFVGTLAYTLACLLVSGRSYTMQSGILRAREQQQAERLRIDTAMRHLSQPLVLLDENLEIMLINPGAVRLLGLPEDYTGPWPRFPELLGTAPNLARATGNPDEFLGHAALLVAARQPFNGVLRLNDDRVIELECIPVPDVGWVTIMRDITGEHNAIAELNRELRRCALTGLPNRRAFIEELERRLARDAPISLLMIDLDGFKQINERHGRAVGDRMLTRVGFRLRTAAPGLFVARMAGDEFAVLIDGNDPDRATAMAQTLLAAIDAPARFGEAEIVLGAAIGIALAPPAGMLAETLTHAADLALLAARAEPANPIRIHSPALAEQAARAAAVDTIVRGAIRQQQVQVVYQPMLDVRSGKVIAVEALARMPASGDMAISSDEMIAIAEARGLIGNLRQQVLRQGARAVATCSPDLSLWINASVIDLRNPAMVDEILADLAAAGLPPDRCAIEITESALLADEAACLANLQRLIALGAGVAMDDFGAGFSSLHRLGRLPMNALKISGQLLTGIGSSPVAASIFRGAVSLGQSLGMVVVAEGVETAPELALAQAAGVNRVQGFLLSHPVSADDLAGAIMAVEAKATGLKAA